MDKLGGSRRQQERSFQEESQENWLPFYLGLLHKHLLEEEQVLHKRVTYSAACNVTHS